MRVLARLLPAACGLLLIVGTLQTARATESVEALPAWIWAGHDRFGDERVALRTQFQINEPLLRARLRCATDFCRVELRLNDQVALIIEPAAPWIDEEITRHLKRGTNTVELRCNGIAGPSAVALSIDSTTTGSRSVSLVSGTDWKARSLPDGDWQPATSFGTVAEKLWGVNARSIAVSPFEDYEQWRRALDAESDDLPPLLLPEGFKVERLRKAQDDEGSWISMAFDPQGRLIISREDQGLLRMTLSEDRDEITSVDTIDDSLKEVRGLLFAYDALYANANNSKGLYRLRDTDGDDQFDEVRLLRAFPGGVGHGRNDLALGPDGLIYSIHGDSVEVPREDVTDRTSPFREHRRGKPTSEGYLIRTDRNGSQWEIVAAGLRNPYGIAFHADEGEAFTYDADAEHDMGAPWYRPTRVVQLVSGADYGWRGVTGSWPPYYPDHADNTLPAFDIGKGSPTAVAFGAASNFPPRFREALFILDWAYGRVIAVHLIPRGAGYTAQAEVFLSGRPLNVTDLTFGPDGAMYLITGGRKTESSLYRIRYIGPQLNPPALSEQQRAHAIFSKELREIRRRLEAFHGHVAENAIATCWPYLNHDDPMLRHAARIAIEHQPMATWKERALVEVRPTVSLTALLALARAGESDLTPQILTRLNATELATLTESQLLDALQIYSLCLEPTNKILPELRSACREQLQALAETSRPAAMTASGLGRPARRELMRLLIELDAPGSVARSMQQLVAASDPLERVDWLYMLRNERQGWTPDLRQAYFGALNEAENYQGGRGYPGFLQTIRDEATATLTQDERARFAELIAGPRSAMSSSKPLPDRPFVREWKMEDVAALLDDSSAQRDLARGERMFHAAACSRCHRVGTIGSAVGPDLTSLAQRFSRRDMLESILEPSNVVADPYRNVEVVTNDGRIIVGQIVASGDYRSSILKIAPDSLRPASVIEIPKGEIEIHQDSSTSPMPAGLLNTLNRDEILDLLAWLESGGIGRDDDSVTTSSDDRDVRWKQTDVLSAAEAHQATAADERFVYAISSTAVAKYDRASGKRIAVSKGEAKHLNSGFLHEGRLYLAHSNYPKVPEQSEIYVLDPDEMTLRPFKSFGNFGGSLTWALWKNGSWWCNFARYGDVNSETFLVQFDNKWQELGRWTYPEEVIRKLGRYSLSGGTWRGDSLLVTGHDDPVMFELRLAEESDVLDFVGTHAVPFHGQGFAHDPVTDGLVGIRRAKRQIVFAAPE